MGRRRNSLGMKTNDLPNLFAAVTTACSLALLPACSDSGSDTRAPGDLAGMDGTDGEEGDEEPVESGEADTDPLSGADETDGGSTTGGEADGSTGAADGETTSGEEGDTTGELPPTAELDGDNEVNPAVRVQFRATSPGPISLDAPLFNDDAIDTQGLLYEGEVSNPGDAQDFVAFNIVPGQVDPYIGLALDCGTPGLGSDSVRAQLFDADGTLLETVVCGEDEQQVLLEGASAAIEYRVRVEVLEGSELFNTYALALNGYCFQACDFQPYEA